MPQAGQQDALSLSEMVSAAFWMQGTMRVL